MASPSFASESRVGPTSRSRRLVDHVPKAVVAAAVVMGCLMTGLSLVRHWHFQSLAFDLGFYVQNVWAIGEGIWRNTIGGFHVFDDHFSPVLILLAPLGRLPTAEALLILQGMAVASGLIPAYRLGSRYGGPSLGRLAALWYGLSSAIWHAVAFDFHPVTLGVPLLMWLINAADEGRRPVVSVVLALMLALIREDLAVLAGVVLIQSALLRGQRRGALWSLLPVSIGVGFIAWATFGSGMGGYHLWTRFSGGGGGSIFDLLAGAAGNLVRPDPVISFSAVLLPVLVVPAFAGWRRSWPGLGMMLVSGIASYAQQASLYFQYFAPVVPFLLWGAVSAWSRFRPGSARGLAVVATICLFALLGPLFYIGFGLPDRFASAVVLSGERRTFAEVLELIPPDGSVSATEFLVPHLARREKIYPFPGPMICAESLIFHVDRTSFPAYAAIEWEDAVPGPDWRAFLVASGYEEVATTGDLSVWNLTGQAPPSVTCPSIDEVRRRLDAGIADWSGL